MDQVAFGGSEIEPDTTNIIPLDLGPLLPSVTHRFRTALIVNKNRTHRLALGLLLNALEIKLGVHGLSTIWLDTKKLGRPHGHVSGLVCLQVLVGNGGNEGPVQGSGSGTRILTLHINVVKRGRGVPPFDVFHERIRAHSMELLNRPPSEAARVLEDYVQIGRLVAIHDLSYSSSQGKSNLEVVVVVGLPLANRQARPLGALPPENPAAVLAHRERVGATLRVLLDLVPLNPRRVAHEAPWGELEGIRLPTVCSVEKLDRILLDCNALAALRDSDHSCRLAVRPCQPEGSSSYSWSIYRREADGSTVSD